MSSTTTQTGLLRSLEWARRSLGRLVTLMEEGEEREHYYTDLLRRVEIILFLSTECIGEFININIHTLPSGNLSRQRLDAIYLEASKICVAIGQIYRHAKSSSTTPVYIQNIIKFFKKLFPTCFNNFEGNLPSWRVITEYGMHSDSESEADSKSEDDFESEADSKSEEVSESEDDSESEDVSESEEVSESEDDCVHETKTDYGHN
jgi:hypothetical protein